MGGSSHGTDKKFSLRSLRHFFASFAVKFFSRGEKSRASKPPFLHDFRNSNLLTPQAILAVTHPQRSCVSSANEDLEQTLGWVRLQKCLRKSAALKFSANSQNPIGVVSTKPVIPSPGRLWP